MTGRRYAGASCRASPAEEESASAGCQASSNHSAAGAWSLGSHSTGRHRLHPARATAAQQRVANLPPQRPPNNLTPRPGGGAARRTWRRGARCEAGKPREHVEARQLQHKGAQPRVRLPEEGLCLRQRLPRLARAAQLLGQLLRRALGQRGGGGALLPAPAAAPRRGRHRRLTHHLRGAALHSVTARPAARLDLCCVAQPFACVPLAPGRGWGRAPGGARAAAARPPRRWP